MEELRTYRGTDSEEQMTIAAHESKYQQSRHRSASKSTSVKLMTYQYESNLRRASPSDPSPPLTPSPQHPFAHLDSTSSASLSHLAPQSHASLHNAEQVLHTSTESDVSSLSPCHAAASTPRKVSIDTHSSKRVSLEQHLQQGDAGREEAMQSFILQRFLPAAKTVAADHDRTIYSTGKRTMPSIAPHSNLTTKAAPAQFMKSVSSFNASKRVAWSRPLTCEDEGENESVNYDLPAKSCGFFCAGFKSATSRAQNVVHTPAHTASRSKSRETLSSSYGGTSSEEEDVTPKVEVMMPDTQKQRTEFMPAPLSFSASAPTSITILDASPRGVASLKKSVVKCPVENVVADSHTHSDSRLLLNLCIKCHSSSSLHQPPVQRLLHERGGSCRQSAENSRCTCGHDSDVNVSCHCDYPKQAPAEASSNDDSLQNANNRNVSRQDSARQARFKEGRVRHNMFEAGLRDQYFSEDDEAEFYDALSRFDISASTVSNDSSLQKCKSSKSQNASMFLQKCTFDEHNVVDTNHAYVSKRDTMGFDADHEGHVEVPTGLTPRSTFKQKRRNSSRHESDVSAYSSISSSCQLSRPNGHKTSSSSPVLGWPLGISSFQSNTMRALPQEIKNYDDGSAANTKTQFTKTVEVQGKHNGKRVTNLNTICANKAFSEEEKKRCDNGTGRVGLSLNLSSPPVPPSPTTSWLGKALAMKASKPSHLATLQQDEKVLSAKKKLEFTSTLDAKKEVKWEDMVKGSQMHPEQFNFSEEIRHHHPANQNAVKPLAL